MPLNEIQTEVKDIWEQTRRYIAISEPVGDAAPCNIGTRGMEKSATLIINSTAIANVFSRIPLGLPVNFGSMTAQQFTDDTDDNIDEKFSEAQDVVQGLVADYNYVCDNTMH
jgi:hypothetical protein